MFFFLFLLPLLLQHPLHPSTSVPSILTLITRFALNRFIFKIPRRVYTMLRKFKCFSTIRYLRFHMKFVRIFLAFDENELATQCTMLAFKKKKNFNEKNGNDHREDHVLEKKPSYTLEFNQCRDEIHRQKNASETCFSLCKKRSTNEKQQMFLFRFAEKKTIASQFCMQFIVHVPHLIHSFQET